MLHHLPDGSQMQALVTSDQRQRQTSQPCELREHVRCTLASERALLREHGAQHDACAQLPASEVPPKQASGTHLPDRHGHPPGLDAQGGQARGLHSPCVAHEFEVPTFASGHHRREQGNRNPGLQPPRKRPCHVERYEKEAGSPGRGQWSRVFAIQLRYARRKVGQEAGFIEGTWAGSRRLRFVGHGGGLAVAGIVVQVRTAEPVRATS